MLKQTQYANILLCFHRGVWQVEFQSNTDKYATPEDKLVSD